MTKKGIKRKATYKQTTFEVAVRNPDRYLGIFDALEKYEGKILNDENLLEIVSTLYLAGEVTSDKIKISDTTKLADITKLVKVVNSSRKADGGFPEGYASRFWTYMRTPSELGMIYARYNEPFQISAIAKKLIAREIDEQEAFSIQAIRYNRRSPYRNVSNDYNFFRLALEMILYLRSVNRKLSYEQFIVLMFNKSGEIQETLDIFDSNKFRDEEQVYNFVSEHYGNTNKYATVMRDYPDVTRRIMIIAGFITIRYTGKKFIEINESKLNYIKALLNIKVQITDEAKSDARAYYQELNFGSDIFLSLIEKYRKEDVLNGIEYTNKIHEIISLYKITEDSVIESIANINKIPAADVISEFREIPAPLKLEFYVSILLALKYKDTFYIRPNYKADHIGKPYSHAPGNYGDIDVYSSNVYWLIEVTLIRNKTQQLNNETTSVIRHLIANEEFKDRAEKYLSFVAPKVHDDTKSYLDYSLVQNQLEGKKMYIKPYDVDSFVTTTISKKNLDDMETYSKKVFADFKDKLK